MACSVCVVGGGHSREERFHEHLRTQIQFVIEWIFILSFIHPFPHRLCCTHRVGKTAIGSRGGELPGLTPLQRLPTSLYSQRQEKDLDVPSFCTFKYTPSA